MLLQKLGNFCRPILRINTRLTSLRFEKNGI
jgi:hypothetical protein